MALITGDRMEPFLPPRDSASGPPGPARANLVAQPIDFPHRKAGKDFAHEAPSQAGRIRQNCASRRSGTVAARKRWNKDQVSGRRKTESPPPPLLAGSCLSADPGWCMRRPASPIRPTTISGRVDDRREQQGIRFSVRLFDRG